MCGIIGYRGPLDAQTVVLRRPLPSSNVVMTAPGSPCLMRTQRSILSKSRKSCRLRKVRGKLIVPTADRSYRLATHGGVTSENAHPHVAGR